MSQPTSIGARQVIGDSQAFRKVVAAIEKVAAYDVPVLIEGETGTGKDLVARALHYGSRRRGHPFVPVNCGALPESLVENELFGHRRGAFTDAREDQAGLVEVANGGTLFLDEIDALPPKGQAALLRFLQDLQYRPLGNRGSSTADVRVIAATNRDLLSMCRERSFRDDLLYRLQLVCIRVPPLRERPGDAVLLARHFVGRAAERFAKVERPVSPRTLSWLDRYDWPGNVRELEHLVYREVLLCEGDLLDIPPPGAGSDAAILSAALRYREAKARAIAAFERRYLEEAMARAAWNVSEAARAIGTERRHLGRLLRKYGVSRPQA